MRIIIDTNIWISYFLFNSFSEFDKILIDKSIIKARDNKDNYLIDLAISSKSTYLITGDKDLLSLNKRSRTKIIWLTDFLNFYKGGV